MIPVLAWTGYLFFGGIFIPLFESTVTERQETGRGQWRTDEGVEHATSCLRRMLPCGLHPNHSAFLIESSGPVTQLSYGL